MASQVFGTFLHTTTHLYSFNIQWLSRRKTIENMRKQLDFVEELLCSLIISSMKMKRIVRFLFFSRRKRKIMPLETNIQAGAFPRVIVEKPVSTQHVRDAQFKTPAPSPGVQHNLLVLPVKICEFVIPTYIPVV